jgi:hypothetical protein
VRSIALAALAALAATAKAEYVELGNGGSLLMNVPFCGG